MEYPLDVAILVSYFGAIGALCWQLRHLFGQAVQSTRPTSYLFLALSAVSFLLTWTFMLQYFLHSYREWVSAQHVISDVGTLDRVSRWLHDVSLFDDAWRFVSSGPWQWLWSHQLCNFTALVWMPFLAFEGSRRKVPYLWAFMLLGQIVAISVASGLFFAVIMPRPKLARNEPSHELTILVTVCMVISSITIILSPFFADSLKFLPNLLLMHALLIVPLAKKPEMKSGEVPSQIERSWLISTVYTLAAGIAFAIYTRQWMDCISSTPEVQGVWTAFLQLVGTFVFHPAQLSISFDVICVNVLCATWILLHTPNASTRRQRKLLTLAALLVPILSASVVMPIFLAFSERFGSITL